MNFNIVDGDRDYLELAGEYARLYNNHKIPVSEIRERLNLSQNKHYRLLAYCREHGLVKPRYKYNKWDKRPKNEKKSIKNYTIVKDKHHRYYAVRKFIKDKEYHFATFKKEEQAQRMVELLRECNWDYSKRYELKEQVLNES